MLALASISDQLDHVLFDFKACVDYVLTNFYFSSKDSPSKAKKNVFISSRKHFLLWRYSLSLLFLPVSHCFSLILKFMINLKVYDVISCLNKYWIAHFVWYLEEEKTMMLKLCPLIEYYIRNIFMEKSCRKYVPKASPRPLFYFGK